jgi:hypothetical protein
LWPEFCPSNFAIQRLDANLFTFLGCHKEQTMKLWQAILVGCGWRNQTNDTLFSKALDGAVSSCALGAAYEGIAGEVCWDSNRAFDRLEKSFPVLKKEMRCPVTGCSVQMRFHTLGCIITHLNDKHVWSRERIALEVVRPNEEQAESGSSPDVDDFPTAA